MDYQANIQKKIKVRMQRRYCIIDKEALFFGFFYMLLVVLKYFGVILFSLNS
jgi:hypothetical protein